MTTTNTNTHVDLQPTPSQIVEIQQGPIAIGVLVPGDERVLLPVDEEESGDDEDDEELDLKSTDGKVH